MIARLGGYTLSTLLLPVVWAGTYVGERIGNRISQDTFSKVLAVMLLLSGISVLVK